MACCSYCPVTGTRVGDHLAGRDVLPPIPEDGLLVLRADFGVGKGVLCPINKTLSRLTVVALARARAVVGVNGLVSPRTALPG